MKEKNKKEFSKLILFLVTIIILLIGFIGYREFYFYNLDSSKVEDKENDVKDTEETVEISVTEIERYLNYVPLLEEINYELDYADYYDYNEDAYSGGLKTKNDLNEKLFLANTYVHSEKVNSTELVKMDICGNNIYCEADSYVLVDTFEENLENLYNIQDINYKEFNIAGGGVENTGEYYALGMGRGANKLEKINKYEKYSIDGDNLIIYEKAGFVAELEQPSVFKTTNAIDVIKTFDSLEYAKKYISDNINNFNTFKHVFKKNNVGYYWYSTELVD